MRCPDCLEDGDVKWLLRHQKINEEDTSTNANVITVLCTKCGKNESVFIEDYLEDIFFDWDDREIIPIEDAAAIEAIGVEEDDNDLSIEDDQSI